MDKADEHIEYRDREGGGGGLGGLCGWKRLVRSKFNRRVSVSPQTDLKFLLDSPRMVIMSAFVG